MTLTDLARNLSTEDQAIAFLEKILWPDGSECPHCGLLGEAYRLKPKANGKTHVRPGVWKCAGCRKQFTVKVGTIFEDSHIPLHKWLQAIHLLCASKKGMSSHQIHRMLGITYKSAWFMTHRIRYAMAQPHKGKLKGTVEADETYVGGKRRGRGGVGRPGPDSHKAPVVALVERKGNVRSFHVERVTGSNLRSILRENIEPQSNLMTDDFSVYDGLGKDFAAHDVISRVYSRREGEKRIHTNTAEGFFSILKRGVYGTFHHVGRQHLHRYLSEFDFRYNSRETSDGERALLAVLGVQGKRLMYRTGLNLQN